MIREANFEKVAFCVEPYFYFIGRNCSPLFGLSVKYAVRMKASSTTYFTTTHLSALSIDGKAYWLTGYPIRKEIFLTISRPMACCMRCRISCRR